LLNDKTSIKTIQSGPAERFLQESIFILKYKAYRKRYVPLCAVAFATCFHLREFCPRFTSAVDRKCHRHLSPHGAFFI